MVEIRFTALIATGSTARVATETVRTYDLSGAECRIRAGLFRAAAFALYGAPVFRVLRAYVRFPHHAFRAWHEASPALLARLQPS